MSHRSIGIDLLGNKDWEEIVHCECSTVGEYLQTIYQLALKAKTEDITETIIEKKFGRKSVVFELFRTNMEIQDSFTKCPFQIEEGIIQCNSCGSKRTFSYQKQTRSADEPMTTFSTCVQCGKKWRYSG